MDIPYLFKLGMDRVLPQMIGPPTNGLELNLGAGNKLIPGAIALDLSSGWNADKDDLPYPDRSVAVIHAYHLLEHLRHPIRLLAEVDRVLMPGGVMNIVVPYYTSQMMAQDLTHQHAFCEETWRNLFANDYYVKVEAPAVWRLRVGLNIIIGIVERNLCLMTQLVAE